MNGKMKKSVLYPAWKTVWRMRCCPPDAILYGESSKELQEHLEGCPYCREDLEQAALYSGFPVFPDNKEGIDTTTPEPGQLWSLTQELGGWGPKKRYYTPPLVVVIEVNGSGVTVLQCCGDMVFAGKDDIPFQNDMTGFIQPWNQYTLCLEDLGGYRGTVFDDSLGEILLLQKEQVVEPGSLLWFFRQMEVETGYFFSSQAVSRLLQEYESEKSVPQTGEGNIEDMYDQLCGMGISFQRPLSAGDSPEDLLFAVSVPDELLPLAASDSSESTDYAICLTMDNGKAEKLKSTGIQFTDWSLDNGFLHIIGQLQDVVSENAQVFVRLQVGDTFFSPVAGEFGIEKDLFWALFQVADRDMEKGVCIVRILDKQ